MKKNNTLTGTMFYKYNGDDLDLIRIKRAKSQNNIVCIKAIPSGNNTIEYEHHSLDELHKDYVELTPDGTIVFNIVNTYGDDDVIISLIRREDLNKGDSIPYAACRQNIKDIFEHILQGQIDYRDCGVGLSISVDTVPAGIDYKNIFAANTVISTELVNIYNTDTLYDILEFINPLKYNDVLLKNFKSARSAANAIGTTMSKGYCTTLKELLINNNFMDDIDRGFHIIRLPETDLSYCEEDNHMKAEDMKVLMEITSKFYKNHFIAKFDKTIDLSKVEYDHILLRDRIGNIYIMIYSKEETVLSNTTGNEDILRSLKY